MFLNRLAEASDVHALYETACLLEHSCIPNIKLTFDDNYHVIIIIFKRGLTVGIFTFFSH